MKKAVFIVSAVFTLFFTLSAVVFASVSETRSPLLNDYGVMTVIVSDSDNFRWTYHLQSNRSSYDESDYSEYKTFGFSLGSAPTSVTIQGEWKYVGALPTEYKIEVWEQDTATWHDELGITIDNKVNDTSFTRDVSSYINSAVDVNNIKLRLVGYRGDSSTSDIEIDMVRVNVNSGAIIKYPGNAICTSVPSVQNSDGVYLPYAGSFPNSAYDENKWFESNSFGFEMPTGAVMGSVVLTYEWQWNKLSGGPDISGSKLEVWEQDNPGWNIHNHAITVPARGVDATATVEVVSYINTANDINNIKIRQLGYTTLNGVNATRPDFVQIKAKRKIIANDVPIYGPTTYTLYAGDTNKLVMDVKIPDDDGVADTLTGFKVRNLGTASDTTDIAALYLYADGGDPGFQGSPTDTLVGTLAWNGGTSQWEIASVSASITVGGRRFFVIANMASNPTDGRTVKMEIPVDGITVASNYGGPTDTTVYITATLTINGMIAAQIVNTGAPADPNVSPGAANTLLMDISAPINGATADTLTGLRVRNLGTAVDTTDIAAMNLYRESGVTPGFQSAQDTLLGELVWDSGCPCWANMTLSHAYSSALRLYVTADIAASPVDGRTIQAYLPQGISDSTAGVVVSSNNDGPINATLANAATQTINGMVAAQVTNNGAPADTLYANDTNELVLDVTLPSNGGIADTLTGLRIVNTGTAVNTDVPTLKFWADRDDDGAYEPTGDDAPALGTGSWNASGWWENLTLSYAIPSAGKRFFVSADVGASPVQFRTLQMALKTGSADGDAGVVVASGNDGPRDSQVVNSAAQTLKWKLAATGVSKAPINVEIGSTNNSMLNLTLTASQGTIQVSSIKIDLTGTAQATDISAARLWHDNNDDGAWDAGDSQLSTSQTFSGGTLTFNAVGLNVVSGATESLVVTYDAAPGAVTGRTAGATLVDTTYITVDQPSYMNVLFASQPVSTSNTLIGRTMTVSGVDKAPNQVSPGTDNVVLEQLTLTASSGSISVTGVTTKLTGINLISDIVAAKLYRDVNGDGAYDGGDVLLATGTFSGSPATVNFPISESVTAGTPRYLLVAYQVSPTTPAGRTIGMLMDSTSHVTVSGGENVYLVGGSIQSSLTVIDQCILMSSTNKAPATALVGKTSVPVLWIATQVSSGVVTMTSLKIDRIGTGLDTDVSGAILYNDVNNDGLLDGGDTPLSTKTFSGGTLTFNALTYSITYPQTKHLLIVFNISNTAAPGGTVGARVLDETYVTVSNPAKISPFSEMTSSALQIVSTLTVSGTDRAAAKPNVTKGQTNAVFEQLSVTSQAGTLNVATVKVDLTGTNAADADISAARLYNDVNGNGTYEGGTDLQLGADKVFSSKTLTFDGFSLAIASGTTKSLLIAYNISAGATQGHGAGAKLTNNTYVTVSQSGVTMEFTTTPIASTNLSIMNPASLTSVFQSISTPVNKVNEPIDITLTVSNAAGSSSANAVAPNPVALTKIYGGAAAVTLLSGPVPATGTISGGGSLDFVYQFRADEVGTVQFEANATGTESNLGTIVTSNTVQSNVITINDQVGALWQFSDGGLTQQFYAGGIVEWDCPTGAGVTSLYIGNNNGKFYAVRVSDGVKRWSYTALAALKGPPVIDYETCNIYFGDTAGRLYAIHDDGASASNAWGPTTLSAGNAINTTPMLDLYGVEKRVYAITANGMLYCKAADTGATCAGWTDANLGAAVSSDPTLSADNFIWAPTEGGTIRKVDKTNGAIVQTYTGYGAFKAPPFAFPRDVNNYSLGNWLFIGDMSKKLYRIDTWQAPGAEKAWTFSPSSPVAAKEFKKGAWFNQGFVVAGNLRVYAGNDNGCLYAIDYTNGTMAWKYPAGSSFLSSAISTGAIFYNDVVYFGTAAGKYYAVQDDGTSASLLTGWPFTAAGAFSASPNFEVYSENIMMLASEDGKVYAFPLQ